MIALMLACAPVQGDSAEPPWPVSESPGQDEDAFGHPRSLLADCKVELSDQNGQFERWSFDERGHLVVIDERVDHQWEPIETRTLELDQLGRPIELFQDHARGLTVLTTSSYEGDSWRVSGEPVASDSGSGEQLVEYSWTWTEDTWTRSEGEHWTEGTLGEGLRTVRTRSGKGEEVSEYVAMAWQQGRLYRVNLEDDHERAIHSYDEEGRLAATLDSSLETTYSWECP